MRQLYINGRFFSQRMTGEQRYAYEMTRAMDEFLDAYEWEAVTIVVPAGVDIDSIMPYKRISIRQVGHFSGHIWEQLELPFYTWDGFLINFCDMAPVLKKNQSVTIHDMAIYRYPEYYTRAFKRWHDFVYRCVCRRARRIFTVSNFSSREMQHFLAVPDEKVVVVSCAVSSFFMEEAVSLNLLDKWNIASNAKVLLAVSSLSPNKNFHSIVEALQYLDLEGTELVIAGGANPKEFSTNSDKGLEHARYVGYVTDAELKALYRRADCFVYPSFYEGFGLPPFEAMVNHCAVVASNTTAIPEVCGDAVLYCDPHNPRDIAAKIHRILTDDLLRIELQKRGDEKVHSYSWRKSAKKMLDVLSGYCG